MYATYVKRINQKTPQQSQRGKHAVIKLTGLAAIVSIIGCIPSVQRSTKRNSLKQTKSQNPAKQETISLRVRSGLFSLQQLLV